MLAYGSPFWAALILLVAWALAALPLFKVADKPPTPAVRRNVEIDGLRGFLALLVVVHHAYLYHRYIAGQGWHVDNSAPYATAGEVGVAIFFMITGYLFWGQMLRAHGRPNWSALYIGRLFRILPLYWVAVAAVVVAVIAKTELHLRVSPQHLVASLAEWLGGGVFREVPLNGYQSTWLIVAGVTWTLRYEWCFYASLFILGRLCRWRVLGLAFPLSIALIASASAVVMPAGLGPASWNVCLAFFGWGASVASLLFARDRLPIPDWAGSTAVLGCLALALFAAPNANLVGPVLLLALAFAFVANGASLFGLLQTKPSKRLGDISYGIYLLQGPVLVAVFGTHATQRASVGSPVGHWLLATLSVCALVALATATHALVELPGMELGKRLLRRRSGRVAPAAVAC